MEIRLNDKLAKKIGRNFFYFPKDEKLVNNILYEIFEAQVYGKGLEYIKKIEKPVVVDLGAFIGLTPIYFGAVPNSTVYAYEPNPDSYNYMIMNTRGQTNIKTINKGVGYLEGPRPLFIPSKKEIAMSMYDQSEEYFMVKTVSFDKIFTENNLDHIDLLKIDTEGCEYEIFLSEEIKKYKGKIGAIIGEGHTHPILYTVIPYLLERLGFKTEWLPFGNTVYNFKLGNKENTVVSDTIDLPTMFYATNNEIR